MYSSLREQTGNLPRTTLVVSFIVVFMTVLAPPLVESVPQYPGTFIKTNYSRQATHKGDNQHRNGNHQRHTATLVETTTGLLHGIRRTVLQKDVHVYLGVPFAKPPLGPLRFKKPIPVEPWNGTLYATRQPNTCYQEHFESFPGFPGEMMWNPNTNISEDCLYMNLWVPKTKTKTKMPILIWIYGGGYMAGTATLDIYNGDILAAENSVIVVGIQYRVGSFGFLYFGNEDAPGNVGLWDQLMAMKWVKANAAKFGGDPESITLFGESAGGGSVSFHLLSPYSRDYITRGIIQSGTLNTPWSIMDASTAKKIARKLADDSNCTQSSLGDTLQCLRDLPAANISALQWNSYAPIMEFPSAPTIDGKFLPKHPIDMLKEGDFKKAELLIGSNLNEGTYFILYDYINYFKKDGPNCLPRETFLEIIENVTVFGNMSDVQKDAVRFQYTHWEDPKEPCKVTEKFADLVGDYYFICPTNLFAELYASHNAPVYYYFFTQRTSTNPWGEWMGVMHADEIEYVFGLPLNGSTTHTNEEKELSRRIMRYFTTFAETGSPVDENGGEEWPLYTKAEPSYFILHTKQRGTGKGPRAHTCAFWNEFMPVITTGTTSLRGRCEKERWGTSDASPSPTLRQPHITNLHSCMAIIITLASTMIVLLKEFDILNRLHPLVSDDDTSASLRYKSSVYNRDDKKNNASSQNAGAHSRFTISQNHQQQPRLSIVALSNSAECNDHFDGTPAFTLLSN